MSSTCSADRATATSATTGIGSTWRTCAPSLKRSSEILVSGASLGSASSANRDVATSDEVVLAVEASSAGCALALRFKRSS
eukprot:CAMPEP_0194028978 /NCGR_PEP_ID=MMETSP0009_2-20130614/2844_1 /TAXON_ID=210454 /ORGANISM="Grammatophora oceanica, Strain CCMP 410" /LENGTH=80 /DNA_ID=CAMNT_0038668531 /DNA_START=23 /DNA_END=262 /DNA_ORIENTATION=-